MEGEEKVQDVPGSVNIFFFFATLVLFVSFPLGAKELGFTGFTGFALAFPTMASLMFVLEKAFKGEIDIYVKWVIVACGAPWFLISILPALVDIGVHVYRLF